MASAVPAAILGLSGERGAILPGLWADLVLVDGEGQVMETWVGGRT
jgi:N-acetylglucosamine-6-phosphate deacetylase